MPNHGRIALCNGLSYEKSLVSNALWKRSSVDYMLADIIVVLHAKSLS